MKYKVEYTNTHEFWTDRGMYVDFVLHPLIGNRKEFLLRIGDRGQFNEGLQILRVNGQKIPPKFAIRMTDGRVIGFRIRANIQRANFELEEVTDGV